MGEKISAPCRGQTKEVCTPIGSAHPIKVSAILKARRNNRLFFRIAIPIKFFPDAAPTEFLNAKLEGSQIILERRARP